MMGIVLSVFDQSRGPIILLNFPESSYDNHLKQLPYLMDIHDEGFFLHEFEELRTANLVLRIYNPNARGTEDTVMLSIISCDEPCPIDLRSYREIMEYLVHKLRDNLELEKGINKEIYPIEYYRLKELMTSFYRFLIREKVFFEQNFERKIFYELSHEGKTCLMNRLNVTFPDAKNRIWV